MSVEFDEEEYLPASYIVKPQGQDKRGLAEWMVNKGIVKDASKARIVLIIVSAIFFVSSLVIFFGGNIFGSKNTKDIFQEDTLIYIDGQKEPVLIPAGKSVEEVLRKYEKR